MDPVTNTPTETVSPLVHPKKNFLSHLTSAQKLGLALLLLIVVGLPVAIFTLGLQTNLSSRAATSSVPPIIATTILPSAAAGQVYRTTLVGKDTGYGSDLRMAISGLPSGFALDPATSSPYCSIVQPVTATPTQCKTPIACPVPPKGCTYVNNNSCQCGQLICSTTGTPTPPPPPTRLPVLGVSTDNEIAQVPPVSNTPVQVPNCSGPFTIACCLNKPVGLSTTCNGYSGTCVSTGQTASGQTNCYFISSTNNPTPPPPSPTCNPAGPQVCAAPPAGCRWVNGNGCTCGQLLCTTPTPTDAPNTITISTNNGYFRGQHVIISVGGVTFTGTSDPNTPRTTETTYRDPQNMTLGLHWMEKSTELRFTVSLSSNAATWQISQMEFDVIKAGVSTPYYFSNNAVFVDTRTSLGKSLFLPGTTRFTGSNSNSFLSLDDLNILPFQGNPQTGTPTLPPPVSITPSPISINCTIVGTFSQPGTVPFTVNLTNVRSNLSAKQTLTVNVLQIKPVTPPPTPVPVYTITPTPIRITPTPIRITPTPIRITPPPLR